MFCCHSKQRFKRMKKFVYERYLLIYWMDKELHCHGIEEILRAESPQSSTNKTYKPLRLVDIAKSSTISDSQSNTVSKLKTQKFLQKAASSKSQSDLNNNFKTISALKKSDEKKNVIFRICFDDFYFEFFDNQSVKGLSILKKIFSSNSSKNSPQKDQSDNVVSDASNMTQKLKTVSKSDDKFSINDSQNELSNKPISHRISNYFKIN